MTKVLIPRELVLQQDRIKDTKALISRLEKGTKLIEEAVRTGDADKLPLYGKTFLEVAALVKESLEVLTFYQEYLATGKTILIRRTGRPEAMETTDELVEVDAFTLASLIRLGELFGESAIELVDVEPPSDGAV